MKKLILIFFVIISTFIFSEEYVSGKITAKLGSVKENNLTTDMELTAVSYTHLTLPTNSRV